MVVYFSCFCSLTSVCLVFWCCWSPHWTLPEGPRGLPWPGDHVCAEVPFLCFCSPWGLWEREEGLGPTRPKRLPGPGCWLGLGLFSKLGPRGQSMYYLFLQSDIFNKGFDWMLTHFGETLYFFRCPLLTLSLLHFFSFFHPLNIMPVFFLRAHWLSLGVITLLISTIGASVFTATFTTSPKHKNACEQLSSWRTGDIYFLYPSPQLTINVPFLLLGFCFP